MKIASGGVLLNVEVVGIEVDVEVGGEMEHGSTWRGFHLGWTKGSETGGKLVLWRGQKQIGVC